MQDKNDIAGQDIVTLRRVIRAADLHSRTLVQSHGLERFVRSFAKLQDCEQTMLLTSLPRVAAMMNAEGIDASPVFSRRVVACKRRSCGRSFGTPCRKWKITCRTDRRSAATALN